MGMMAIIIMEINNHSITLIMVIMILMGMMPIIIMEINMAQPFHHPGDGDYIYNENDDCDYDLD